MNSELIKKAKAANSPEELLELARENGLEELTLENAKAYFDILKQSGELSDDELSNAAGGGCAIRKNGKKMVSYLNDCGHWRCQYINGPYKPSTVFDIIPKGRYADETLLDATSCKGCEGPYSRPCESAFPAPNCASCYYCSYEKGAWWCNNEVHYYE